MRVRLLAPLVVLLAAGLMAGSIPASASTPVADKPIGGNGGWHRGHRAIQDRAWFSKKVQDGYTVVANGAIQVYNKRWHSRRARCKVAVTQWDGAFIVGRDQVSMRVPGRKTRQRSFHVTGWDEGGPIRGRFKCRSWS